jgi:hypothetical protein
MMLEWSQAGGAGERQAGTSVRDSRDGAQSARQIEPS